MLSLVSGRHCQYGGWCVADIVNMLVGVWQTLSIGRLVSDRHSQYAGLCVADIVNRQVGVWQT